MLANHKEFFFNLLKEHIRGTYGFPRLSEEEYQQKYNDGLLTDQEVQDHNFPGPFSFHSYLSALLNPKMWGDEQVLCLCSMMWQIGLTVVSAETFTQIRFRHRSSLEKADGVLVMCLGQHYVPACKYLSFVPLIRSPFQVIMFIFIAFKCSRMRWDRSILQSDGCILRSDGYITVPPNKFNFPVRRVDGVDALGNVTTVTYCLSPDSVTLACGYDAMKEDPSIYKTLDFCGYSAPKQFPDMQLPVPGAPSVSSSTQQSSTASTQCQFIPEHLSTVIQGMHDEHVRFLKPLGRDPCSYFKEKYEVRILRALGPPTSVISVAGRISLSQSSMSTARCTSLESYRVSIAISCLLILKHCLYIRRFVQNVLKQMILLKRKRNHISVLTAARDIHVPLMWSAIASPSIPIYSCGRMRWDSYIWRLDCPLRTGMKPHMNLQSIRIPKYFGAGGTLKSL